MRWFRKVRYFLFNDWAYILECSKHRSMSAVSFLITSTLFLITYTSCLPSPKMTIWWCNGLLWSSFCLPTYFSSCLRYPPLFFSSVYWQLISSDYQRPDPTELPYLHPLIIEQSRGKKYLTDCVLKPGSSSMTVIQCVFFLWFFKEFEDKIQPSASH